MAEAQFLETKEEAVVTIEEKHLLATDDTYVLYTGAGKQEDESDTVVQPLLQHKHRDSWGDNHKAGEHTATDGTDQKTSDPRELELACRNQAGCTGSVRSLCSDSSRHECPICSELFDSHGDRSITLLNCNHTLCHHCIAGIMRRAKDPGRLQCPFCRQTTPFPQWEIRRLQEESYSSSIYEPELAFVGGPGPELQVIAASMFCCLALERQVEVHRHRNRCGWPICPSCLVRRLGLMQLHSLFCCISALLLLVVVLLGCFVYILLL